MSRRTRILIGAGSVVMVVLLVGGPFFAAYTAANNSAELQDIQQTLAAVQRIETDVQNATGAPAQQAQAAQLQHLIGCLYGVILVHKVPVGCDIGSITPPPTTTVPARVGRTGARGQAGTAGAPGPPGPAGPTGAAGRSAYPFTFTFTVHRALGSTTYTCTVTGPSQGHCT